jgi:hypothetical protein
VTLPLVMIRDLRSLHSHSAMSDYELSTRSLVVAGLDITVHSHLKGPSDRPVAILFLLHGRQHDESTTRPIACEILRRVGELAKKEEADRELIVVTFVCPSMLYTGVRIETAA